MIDENETEPSSDDPLPRISIDEETIQLMDAAQYRDRVSPSTDPETTSGLSTEPSTTKPSTSDHSESASPTEEPMNSKTVDIQPAEPPPPPPDKKAVWVIVAVTAATIALAAITASWFLLR